MTSTIISQVSTTTEPVALAPQTLTTLCFWWVLWVEPGRSRIPGEQVGERLDLSDWLEEIPAVFAHMLEFILNDSIPSLSSLLYYSLMAE